MCVSFRCRYIRLEKLDKSSQDTLSLLSESLIQISLAAVLSEIGHLRLKSQLFRLRQPILLSAGGSKVSCSRFIQFLQAHTSTPERAHDIALLVAVGEVWWKSLPLCIRGGHVKLAVVGNEQAARFYKFASKVLWSRRHLVSWDSWHKVPTNPSEPSVRCERQAAKACLAVNL